MKKNFITSFLFAAAVVAMTLTSCGEEANIEPVSPNPTGQTAFASGETPDMPIINADTDGEAKALSLNSADETRTSMSGKAVNQKFPFYWEPGDKIWVKNEPYKQSAAADITSTQPKAKFMLDGIYSSSRYEVFYTGQNSPQAGEQTANALQVTIADQQTQNGWNNSKHIGTSGDCGTGYAHLQNNGSYTFTIDHKASYLIFYPYLHTALQNDSYTLQKIEIYSDAGGSTIAGTYDFDFANGLADIPTTGTAKQEITLTCGNSFGLSTSVPDLTTNTVYNHCFVVIAPGTHSLTIKYTMKNASGTEFTFIKDITSKQYAENSVYTFIHELRYPEMEFGFEFNEANTFYRWGRTYEAYGTEYINYDTSTSDATNGFWSQSLNTTMVSHYIPAGILFDNATKWGYNLRNGTRTERRGGWWFKKNTYIPGFSRTVWGGNTWGSLTSGRPDATVIDQYFFIPQFGNVTDCWTMNPHDAGMAWTFQLTPTNAAVGVVSKNNAYLAGLRPDGTPWFQ